MTVALGVVRLSVDTDASTSVERQRANIIDWCERQGYELAGIAEDVDVSGAVAPWDRPELSQWWDTPDRYTTIVVSRLDRLTRRVLHLARILEWCQQHNITIVSVSEGFDMSTPVGRLLVQMMGVLAEGELEAIRERTRAAHRHMLTTGRWRGGRPPYGYVSVREGTGWVLRPDTEVSRPIVLGMVDDVLDGRTAHAIATSLQARGVLTPANLVLARAGQPPKHDVGWRGVIVKQILTSPAMVGWCVYTERVGGKRVQRIARDSNGDPVIRCEPLIDVDVWEQVKRQLGRQRDNVKVKTSELLGICFCGVCDRRMYRNVDVYRCSSVQYGVPCGNPSIGVKGLLAFIDEWFMTNVGGVERVRVDSRRSDSVREQLAQVESQLAALREERVTGLWSGDAGLSEWRDVYGRFERQRVDLLARVGGPVVVGTGVTWGSAWANATAQGRLEALKQLGVRVTVGVRGVEPVRSRRGVAERVRVDMTKPPTR